LAAVLACCRPSRLARSAKLAGREAATRLEEMAPAVIRRDRAADRCNSITTGMI